MRRCVSEFSACCRSITSCFLCSNYHAEHDDTSLEFKNIINHDYIKQREGDEKFRMVLYNGDVDTVCSSSQTQYFTEKLASDLRVSVRRLKQIFSYSSVYTQFRAVRTRHGVLLCQAAV